MGVQKLLLRVSLSQKVSECLRVSIFCLLPDFLFSIVLTALLLLLISLHHPRTHKSCHYLFSFCSNFHFPLLMPVLSLSLPLTCRCSQSVFANCAADCCELCSKLNTHRRRGRAKRSGADDLDSEMIRDSILWR